MAITAPAISVLGLKRGGTEARPHPRPARPPDQAAPKPADRDDGRAGGGPS